MSGAGEGDDVVIGGEARVGDDPYVDGHYREYISRFRGFRWFNGFKRSCSRAEAMTPASALRPRYTCPWPDFRSCRRASQSRSQMVQTTTRIPAKKRSTLVMGCPPRSPVRTRALRPTWQRRR